ncbi:MAG: hypothetical protein FJ320_11100 [SAR202 cluster bacterium]|nr:hypothetical protein [SAR202 cluster bacterium]
MNALSGDLGPYLPANYQAHYNQAIRSINSASHEDLASVEAIYPKDRSFWNAPREIRFGLEAQAFALNSSNQGAAGLLSSSPASIQGSPLAAETCPTPHPYEDLWDLRDIEFAAKLAHEVASVDPTGIASAITITPYSIAASALYAAESAYERWDDCETGNLFEQLDVEVSSRASETSVNNVHTSVNNLQTSVNQINTTLTALSADGSLDELLTKVNAIDATLDGAIPTKNGPLSGVPSIFTGAGFTGTEHVISGDISCLSAIDPSHPLIFGIRSLKVPAGTALFLYRHCDFTSPFKVYHSNVSNWLASNPGDLSFGVHSIKVVRTPTQLPDKVASQVSLNAAQDALDAIEAKLDVLSIGSANVSLTAIESSLPRKNLSGPVTIFLGPNYTGQSAVISQDTNCTFCDPNLSVFHQKVRSIRVSPGTSAVLYLGAFYAASSKTFNVDTPDIPANAFLGGSIKVTRTQGSFPDTIASQVSLDSHATTITNAITAIETKLNTIEPKKQVISGPVVLCTIPNFFSCAWTIGFDAGIPGSGPVQVQLSTGPLDVDPGILACIQETGHFSNLGHPVLGGVQRSSALASVRVPPGSKLELFGACNFQNKIREYTTDTPNTGDVGLVYSMRVTRTTSSVPDVIASQASVDSLAAKINSLSLTGVNAAIQAIEAKLDAIDLSNLDAPVSTRAQQSTLVSRANSIDAALAALEGKLDSLNSQFDAFDVDVRGALQAMSNADNAHDAQFDSFDVDVRGALQNHGNALNALEAKLDNMASQNTSTGEVFQSLVTSVIDRVKIDLDIVEVKEKSRWLIACSEAGAPVSGVQFTSFLAINTNGNGAPQVTNVTSSLTVTEVAPGLYDVRVSLPNSANSASSFRISVSRTFNSDLGSVTHHGTALFSRNASNNLN